MSVKTNWQTLKISDGTEMRAYVASPSTKTGKKPAIIVLQEAFGVNKHMQDVTERIAALGYVAASPELYHRTAPGFAGDYNDRDTAMKNMGAMTDDGQIADFKATYEWLAQQADVQSDKIAVVGYCMGGRSAFLANAVLPLKAAVSYYGGRIAPDLLPRANDQHGPLLFFWGGLDKRIPAEQRRAVHEALDQAKKPYTTVRFSYADHAFFCDDRSNYNAEASEQSWSLFTAFLEKNFR